MHDIINCERDERQIVGGQIFCECDLTRDGYTLKPLCLPVTVSVNHFCFRSKAHGRQTAGRRLGGKVSEESGALVFSTGQKAALAPLLLFLFITGHVMGSLHTIALHYGPYKNRTLYFALCPPPSLPAGEHFII